MVFHFVKEFVKLGHPKVVHRSFCGWYGGVDTEAEQYIH